MPFSVMSSHPYPNMLPSPLTQPDLPMARDNGTRGRDDEGCGQGSCRGRKGGSQRTVANKDKK